MLCSADTLGEPRRPPASLCDSHSIWGGGGGRRGKECPHVCQSRDEATTDLRMDVMSREMMEDTEEGCYSRRGSPLGT